VKRVRPKRLVLFDPARDGWEMEDYLAEVLASLR
jgi:hypothetical protein